MGEDAPLKVGVAGANGRMGGHVIAALQARADFELAAAFDRPGSGGGSVSGVPLGERDDVRACEVVIDFSTAQASAALAADCADRGGPALVIGSTGWTAAEDEAVARAAERIAIVRAGNFSLGVNLLAALVEDAAARLPADAWDIEIFEAHHGRKVDAPSGTALMLGEAAARGRGVALQKVQVRARDGLVGPREPGSIGFSVVRGGGVVGEHQVWLAGRSEVLTLAHSAGDRSLFADGAIAAARWIVGRPPGLYGMRDVLGL